MNLILALALIFTLNTMPQTSYAKMYIWTDKDGVKHFSDTPPPSKQPPAPRVEPEVSDEKESVEETVFKEDPPEKVMEAQPQETVEQAKTTSTLSADEIKKFLEEDNGEKGFLNLGRLKSIFMKKPVKTNSPGNTKKKDMVEMYIVSWDAQCKQAMEFFDSKGIAYKAYDIEEDRDARLRKKQIDPTGRIPLVIVNGKMFFGYLPEGFQDALY